MSDLRAWLEATPSDDDIVFGKAQRKLDADAAPQTIPRIAAIIRRFNGTNDTDLAREICAMIFEGETLEQD